MQREEMGELISQDLAAENVYDLDGAVAICAVPWVPSCRPAPAPGR